MMMRKDSNSGRDIVGYRRKRRGLALLLALAMTIQQSSVLSLAQDQEPLLLQENVEPQNAIVAAGEILGDETESDSR